MIILIYWRTKLFLPMIDICVFFVISDRFLNPAAISFVAPQD